MYFMNEKMVVTCVISTCMCSISTDWSRFRVSDAGLADAASSSKSPTPDSELDRRLGSVCPVRQPSTETTHTFHAGMSAVRSFDVTADNRSFPMTIMTQ